MPRILIAILELPMICPHANYRLVDSIPGIIIDSLAASCNRKYGFGGLIVKFSIS